VLIWTKDTPTTLWVKTALDPSLTASQNTPSTPGKFPDVVWHVSWSLAGNILAVSCGDGKVTLWKCCIILVWTMVQTDSVRSALHNHSDNPRPDTTLHLSH